MTDQISEIFIKDHDEILSLIKEFSRLQANKSQDIDFFRKIRWIIERHIYFEEKTLFDSCELIGKFENDFAEKLMQQHNVIFDKIKSMEKEISLNIFINIHELTGLLDTHMDYEVDFFYKKIDEMLNSIQKKIILDGLSQSANKKYYPIEPLRKYSLEKLKNFC